MELNKHEKDFLIRASKFCAYRERCEFEVRQKLVALGANYPIQEKIIQLLKEGNYLNNERFAEIYARGKHRNNKWGKEKIRQALYQKKIEASIIEHALNEIDEKLYLETLNYLIAQKKSRTKYENEFELRKKIADYLIGKGYESSMVWDEIKKK